MDEKNSYIILETFFFFGGQVLYFTFNTCLQEMHYIWFKMQTHALIELYNSIALKLGKISLNNSFNNPMCNRR